MSEPTEMKCPRCGKQLRLPANAAGKRVRCPSCNDVISVPATDFMASPLPAAPLPPAHDELPRGLRDYDDDDDRPRRRRDDDDDYDRPRGRDRDEDYDDDVPPRRRRYEGSGLTALGICMLLLGIVGFGWDMFNSIAALVLQPPPVPPPDPNVPPWMNDFVREMSRSGIGVGPAITQAVFAVMSGIMIAGGMQMLRRRTWGLCLASCIICMLNFSGCCCVPGIPLGIWGLVLLNSPVVKDAFS